MCIFQSFQKFTKIIPLVLFFKMQPGSAWVWPVGHPRAAPHQPARPRRGARHPVVWAPPCPTYSSLPPILLSLPKKLEPVRSHSRFCPRAQDFLISLLSPDLCLKFGTFVLRYVTPLIIQIEFCLVEYILSICCCRWHVKWVCMLVLSCKN